MHELNKTERERGELIELIAFVRHYLYVPIHAMHFSPMYACIRGVSRVINPTKNIKKIFEMSTFLFEDFKKSSNAQANY